MLGRLGEKAGPEIGLGGAISHGRAYQGEAFIDGR